MLKVSQPAELLPHVGQNVFAHVGEDRGLDSLFLQADDPAQHLLVQRGPHNDIGFDEVVDALRRERKARLIGDLLPVGAAVQVSHVVRVAVSPVVAVEIGPFEAGERKQFLLRLRIFRIAENFSVIEDHSFDRHEYSSR